MPGQLYNKTLCIALNEVIKDEKKAPKGYQDLIYRLDNTGNLSSERERRIRDIIRQEKNHEKTIIRMAAEIGCSIT